MHKLGSLVCAGIFMGTIATAAPVNVAQNATVTWSGTFGSANSFFQTIDNGVFLAEGTQWQTGTVWWTGSGSPNPATTQSLTIDLGQTFSVNGLIVQADNNDSYTLQYETTLGGPWQTLWNVPILANGGGMSTRPGQNSTAQFSISPTDVRAVKFFANGGDGDYSVSEIELFGTPSAGGGGNAPEPATWALLGTGFVGILVRRFHSRA